MKEESPSLYDLISRCLFNLPRGGDSIDNVLDYEYLEQSVNNALSDSRAELQETLARRILDSVMLPQAALAATVSLTKLDPMGFDSQLGCTLVRMPEK